MEEKDNIFVEWAQGDVETSNNLLNKKKWILKKDKEIILTDGNVLILSK